jgi:ATP phosphoribosyltransferase
MLKLALPGGDLRQPTAEALAAVGIGSSDYADGSRSLQVAIDGHDGVRARVFREKDIPIQVAQGAYDLAICGTPWMEEFLARHPDEGLVPLRRLGFGRTRVVLAAPRETVERLGPFEGWTRWSGVRVATEFPFLAERLVRRSRLPRARVLALWGAAEAYPPEDAEACLIALTDDEPLRRHGLAVMATIADGPAWLVASRTALRERNLAPLLQPLQALPAQGSGAQQVVPPRTRPSRAALGLPVPERDAVRLALPDGHAAPHTFRALQDAGLAFDGYEEKSAVRRPVSGIAGLDVKVVRPQDMPTLVAQGNFDLAVTGRDWLLDHRYAFPSTPVVEVADLRRSRYALAAVIADDVPGATIEEALAYWRGRGRQVIRVVAEYPHLADHYARSAHLGRYTVMPVAGASEGFVPEDAEILIEGTETGRSLIANRLRVIDQIGISTNCLIAREDWVLSPRRALIGRLIEQLRAVPAPA